MQETCVSKAANKGMRGALWLRGWDSQLGSPDPTARIASAGVGVIAPAGHICRSLDPGTADSHCQQIINKGRAAISFVSLAMTLNVVA